MLVCSNVNNPDRESVDARKFIGVMFEYFVWISPGSQVCHREKVLLVHITFLLLLLYK